MTDEAPLSPLEPTALRWRCDPACFRFATTAEIEPAEEVASQQTARDAIAYALRTTAAGQNVYVRGPRGTRRRTMVRELLASLGRKTGAKRDRCYVQNFSRPDHPRLLTLAAGQGRELRRRMREFAEFVKRDLPKALEAEHLAAERRAIQQRAQARVTEITEPLERELEQAGMKLVQVQQGPVAQTLIFPVIDGQPVPPPQLTQLVGEGKVTEAQIAAFEKALPAFQQRLAEVSGEVLKAQRSGFEALRDHTEAAARGLLEHVAGRIRQDITADGLDAFLGEVVDDVIETRMGPNEHLPDPVERYGVNVILEHEPDDAPPIVEETTPTLVNLLGTVEVGWGPEGPRRPDYAGVRAGALLRADGGYLVLDVHDLLLEPGAWRTLTRTLRTGCLEIVPPDLAWFRPQTLIHPEPIPISVRVILIGDPYSYGMLDALDPDFGELFKTLADFDHEIVRDDVGIQHYAAVVARVCADENLVPFDPSGVAALVEHGARIAARDTKLTARFGRLADLVREASFLATEASAAAVTSEYVQAAIARTKLRASLPSQKFQELIRTRTIRVDTMGDVVGQVNGLAVVRAGPIMYGFPARITATIGVGRAGLINIEGSAALSGSIHTKGFEILGGLLRHLLRADHPLAFSASIAFEQSYGGIDGDSASGAEICCLLSALTDTPIRQSIAITGAIDQHGHVQAIGGVNEKIEGFFDACSYFGLTGDQGVVIPRANAGDLMLRHDVVEACERGDFRVWAVETIHEALELLTDVPAGRYEDGGYADGTLLRLAVDRAREYWQKALQSPGRDDADE